MKLWMRMGDMGEYQDHDDIEGVAEELWESHVANVTRTHRFGVSSDGFEQDNHISLFWGDDEASPERPLTDDEISYINDYLSTH